jgi:hypothetical protein
MMKFLTLTGLTGELSALMVRAMVRAVDGDALGREVSAWMKCRRML